MAGAQTTVEAWKRDEVPPVGNDGILTAEIVSTLDLQGTWLDRARKFREAIPLAEKAVLLAKRAKHDGDSETAVSLNDLAVLYMQMGESRTAVQRGAGDSPQGRDWSRRILPRD